MRNSLATELKNLVIVDTRTRLCILKSRCFKAFFKLGEVVSVVKYLLRWLKPFRSRARRHRMPTWPPVLRSKWRPLRLLRRRGRAQSSLPRNRCRNLYKSQDPGEKRPVSPLRRKLWERSQQNRR